MHLKIINVFKTIVLAILFTLLLKQFKNYSNFSDTIVIPLIVSLSVKYLLGDWDVGYNWTISDIFYWTCLYVTSYSIIKLINFFNL